jgi:hypothetical protein
MTETIKVRRYADTWIARCRGIKRVRSTHHPHAARAVAQEIERVTGHSMTRLECTFSWGGVYEYTAEFEEVRHD